MSDDPRWWDREPTRPIRVTGGIRARGTRGAIGQRWWSARFIEVLASFGIGGRLDRGRGYARAGQVVALCREAGSVRATVQGSRPTPYQVRIGMNTYGKAEWAQIEQAMADNAWYAAKLLAGEMPPDIEEMFDSVGLTLFPASARDLSMDCDCPDHVVPCKHLAAVCYLLAESFDDDPFGILALRGRDRATLLRHIRARRSAGTSDPGLGEADGFGHGEAASGSGVRPLAECLDTYFVPAGPLPVLPAPHGRPDAVLDQLPEAGLTVRGHRLTDLLRPAYRALPEPA